MTGKAPRSADYPPGYDEEDPYAGVDLTELPEWWRTNVEIFREHGMRPYRPPRFTDGEHTPPIISALESELGVDITLRAVNPEVGERWEIRIDDEAIGTIGRYRDGNGYTIYEAESGEFERQIRSERP